MLWPGAYWDYKSARDYRPAHLGTASQLSTGRGVLVSYPSGPLQYRPMGIRPERPDGQCPPLVVAKCSQSVPAANYYKNFLLENTNIIGASSTLKPSCVN